MYKSTTLVLFYIVIVKAAYEGEDCSKNGVAGTCVNIRNCPAAIDDIRNRRNPQICTFSGADPIVCCVNTAPATTARPIVATTVTTKRTPTTTPYVPPFYDYRTDDENGECEPLSPSLTAPKTGQKAWDKCIEYQEQLVYPCSMGVALTGDLSRANLCRHNADELIVGGVDASEGEFPHVVLLGYGDTPETAQWLCGATLISDRFILTAGHCTSSREAGAVSFALLATLKRNSKVDRSRMYKIGRIIKHPEYIAPYKYNDIALLETETKMQLNSFAVPACLHVGNNVKDEKASAIGWGTVQYRGPAAETLQKVTLTKFPTEECSVKYPASRLMRQGINTTTQMCYGDYTKSKDTCQGDSGGPLQIKNSRIHCMYTIIGVTSFGKACGFVGQPGVYTRVAAYVPWIESVVWP